jgi:hypothetical protein
MFHKFAHVPSNVLSNYQAHRDGNFALPRYLSQRREPDDTSDDPRLEAAAAQIACHRADPDPKQDHVALATSRP